uniref:Predicted protein n=1 Tax=Hordeum vulgare subsp. vulgare TaxID=112509 RepID=F2E0H8_HORVV|nr:predicted protein [Hordeum vulgare subsp. vulgare]
MREKVILYSLKQVLQLTSWRIAPYKPKEHTLIQNLKIFKRIKLQYNRIKL